LFSYVSSGYSSFPLPLSSEEEKRYLKEYAEGSDEAKTILIERNMRLVAHIVKKYNNHTKDSEDLVNIGAIGLIKAIQTFRPERGTRLATYAARCIDNEILMHIRSSKKYTNDAYLQDPLGMDREGNEIRLEDRLADDSDPIDEQVDLKMQIKRLGIAVMTVLQERERHVVMLRYGLKDGEEMTQREIAQLLGISRSYVSRIEKKAILKLGKELGD
jgi:RNA polymerase sporulation-specific sigma factor